MKSILFVLAVIVSTVSANSQLVWKKFGELKQARHFFGAEMCSPSRILIAGGFITSTTDSNKYTIASSCELLDITTGTTTSTSPMSVPRAEFPLLVDKDSNLIALGGVTNDQFTQGGVNKNTTVVERYSRSTGTWQVIGNLLFSRRQHCALFLNENEILVVDGRQDDLGSISNAEIFNLITGTSRECARYPYTLNKLSIFRNQAGKIVAFGGRTGGAGSARYKEVYSYDVSANKWTKLDTLYRGVAGIGAIQLWDERVLVSGGTTTEDGYHTAPVKDIWIEQFGHLGPLTVLKSARSDHSCVQIDPSHVLFTGGWDKDWKPYQDTEVLNIQTGEITKIDNNAPHVLFRMMSVPTPVGSKATTLDRTVLCISGQTGIRFDASANAIGITLTKVIEILTDPSRQPAPCTGSNTNVIDFGSGFEVSRSSRMLKLNQSAGYEDNKLMLVPATSYGRGSAWFNQKLPLGCGFSTDFSFRTAQSDNSGLEDGSLPGADGIALVIQNTSLNAIGTNGQGIGYAGIPNALAIEFDTYRNDANSDKNGNHVAVQCSGSGPVSAEHAGTSLLGINRNILTMRDSVLYFVRVDYNIVPNTMRVFIDETGVFTTPALTIPNLKLSDLLSMDSSRYAYIGFTSSTGVSFSRLDLQTWRLCTCPVKLLSHLEDESNDEQSAFAAAAVALYPNPTANEVNFVFQQSQIAARSVAVRIFNEVGSLVYQSDVACSGKRAEESVSVLTSNWSSGAYIYVCSVDGQEVQHGKLLVLH